MNNTFVFYENIKRTLKAIFDRNEEMFYFILHDLKQQRWPTEAL